MHLGVVVLMCLLLQYTILLMGVTLILIYLLLFLGVKGVLVIPVYDPIPGKERLLDD